MQTVTREQVRQIIVSKVTALIAAYPKPLSVQYLNGKQVDLARQADPYVNIDIKYQGGEQINLGPEGGYRQPGTLVIEVWAKKGTGTVAQNEIIDYLRPTLHMTDDLYPVRLYAAGSASGSEKLGWVPEALIIPFFYDTKS